MLFQELFWLFKMPNVEACECDGAGDRGDHETSNNTWGTKGEFASH